MSDGTLSQEEINALLAVSDDDEVQETDESTEQPAEKIKVTDYLSSIEEDTIGEIGNISFGSSATILSTLLNQKVDITTPKVSVIRLEDLYKEFAFDHVKVQVNYVEGFSGKNIFVIKSSDAAIISDIMLGGDGENPDTELNEIHLSAVQEAMNQMMGGAATSMSTIFNKMVNISPPSIEFNKAGEGNDEHLQNVKPGDEILVTVSFQLKIGTLIDSNIMQLIPFPFANELVEVLLSQSTSSEDVEAVVEQEKVEVPQTNRMHETVKQEPRGSQYLGKQVNQATSAVQQANFSDFEQIELNQSEQRNLDNLLDIPLKVTVELGRTKRPIKDILELSSGSIIELDKLAGEPVDILVNQKLIAQGEVVVIDENFGVRVTDIMSKTDRLRNLN